MSGQASKRNTSGLWLIIAAYVVCASLTAWFMPWSADDGRWPVALRAKYSPPDEGAHLGYIDYLITNRALPVFDDPDANYEAHQPPLYYISCIPAYLLGGGVAAVLGLHSTHEGIVRSVRAWSVVIGAAVIWAVYALALGMFGNDRPKALLAAGFAALLPMHFVNLAGVTNDGLAELTVTLCIIWACKLASEVSDRNALVLGLLVGLAMLVKSSALFIFFVAGVAAILGTRHLEDEGQRLKRIARGIGLTVAAALVVCGWWWVRNQILYGDPLAHRVFVELFSVDRATPEWFFERGLSGVGYVLMIFWGTALSFWGVFGQANVYLPGYGYLVGWAFGLLAITGLVRATRSRRSFWAAAPLCWLLACLGLAFVLAFYLRFNMIFYQVQARYLFTAIGPLAALFAAGWWSLWQSGKAGEDKSSISKTAWTLWWVVLGLLAIMALWYLRPGAPVLGLPWLGT